MSIEILPLAAVFPLGRIIDALEHLPEFCVTPHRPVPVHAVAIVADSSMTPDQLAEAGKQAVREQAGALVLIGSAHIVVPTSAHPLPIIVVSPHTTTDEISHRIRGLELEALSPRLLAEEHARARIVDIVDRSASILGGHILVEDQDFDMVAYSQMVGTVDAARQDAVLQRRMPSYLQRVFNEQGVLASLLSGEDVAHVVPDEEAGLGARLIVAIRHRGRLVGTIWFARAEEAFSERDVVELQAAAEQMSGILADVLRQREDAQIRADDAALNLLRGQSVQAAFAVIGDGAWGAGSAAHVISFGQIATPSGARARLSDFRALAASTVRSVRSEAVIVPEGDRLHILYFGCGEQHPCSASQARVIAEQMIQSLSRVNIDVAVGIGLHVGSPERIVDSARTADRVLEDLLHAGRSGIASVRDSWSALVLDAFFAVSEDLSGVVPREVLELLQSSLPRDRDLIATVHAAIEHWGDVNAVATRFHVHANTVRYRLQRFATLSGVDLGVPAQRLALWILLELGARREPSAP